MKRFRVGTTGIGLLLLCTGACSPGAPRAVFREERCDLGLVRQGESVVHAFFVHNAGKTALRFQGASLSLPGMTCRLPREIAPGEDGQIQIDWSTSHLQGRVEAEAVVRMNDPTRPEGRLVVTGEVEGPVELRPLPEVFLSAFQGEIASRALTLVNHQKQPIAARLIKQGVAHFTSRLRA